MALPIHFTHYASRIATQGRRRWGSSSGSGARGKTKEGGREREREREKERLQFSTQGLSRNFYFWTGCPVDERDCCIIYFQMLISI
mgnify:CR=1 FL=1